MKFELKQNHVKSITYEILYFYIEELYELIKTNWHWDDFVFTFGWIIIIIIEIHSRQKGNHEQTFV